MDPLTFRRPKSEQHSDLKTTITIFKNVVMCSFKYKKGRLKIVTL
ncbi:hypothetical protein NEISICOT_03534 [Neisseria sicca ATCC 29256]|uniref:Uncharacterized protein n=1 Tax=Neisseria sicca ATCC 29256 TaxID=547045 RepID=C6MAF2_NEISI|nr:hypothetical protein NEISICOT_03534 [Neisseria sicca ATCC 29256]